MPKQSSAAEALARIADTCSRTAARYVSEHQDAAVRSELANQLLLASAALETAAERLERRERDAALALMIARALTENAAAHTRERTHDQEFLRCAAACDAAVMLLERALATDGQRQVKERNGARARLKAIHIRRVDVGADVCYGTDTISAVFGEDGEWQVVGRAGRSSRLFLDQALASAAGLAGDEAIRLAEAIHEQLGTRPA